MNELPSRSPSEFVRSFRAAAPYVRAFRGYTLVVVFGGEVVAEGQIETLAQDLALLSALGMRLVLVHGARPQIARQLTARGLESRFHRGWRITDTAALEVVKEAVGRLHLEIGAALSAGLANPPLSECGLRVGGGNFLRARPVGIREGVDFQFTGEVRSVDGEGIRARLDAGEAVLLSPVGYSPTGELFNLRLEEVAARTAGDLRAEKLVFLVEGQGLEDGDGHLQRQLGLGEVQEVLESRQDLPKEIVLHLQTALHACQSGVRRVHLVNRHHPGAILQELFTRDGVGTLIATDRYEDMRPATPDDLGGILELIRPLEEEGILAWRDRGHLEAEVGSFLVMERDGSIVATVALHPLGDQPVAELSCLAVHPDYRGQGRGEALLREAETRAQEGDKQALLVLTTRAEHWFRERGFIEVGPEALPVNRQGLYPVDRRSKVLWKALGR